MKSLAVFCGARHGHDPRHRDEAERLGRLCAREGVRVVYGGGHVGLMGVLADATLAAGGEVTGVIPRDLQDRELAHARVTTLHVVDGMHERKARMGALADAFVALPGGFGTLEEFFEVLTWAQLNFHAKPCGLINVAGYFDGLLAFIDGAAQAGFVKPSDRALIQVATSSEEVFSLLLSRSKPSSL